MDSRWFSPVVVLLWVATMGWLTMDKVLPQLREGDPPTYRALFDQLDDGPVIWDLYVNERAVGRSKSEMKKLDNGGLQIKTELALMSQLSLSELLPESLRLTFLPELNRLPAKGAQIDSQLEVNRSGRLLGMEATLRWGDFVDVLRISGAVVDNELQLVTQVNKVSLPPIKIPLSSETQLVESFAPQSRLMGLRLGQSWTMPVFSPLQPATPVEVLQAVVAREEPIFWDGHICSTLVVEYRKGSGAGGAQEIRGRMWVRIDGLVLKQQATLLTSQLVFVRQTKDEERGIP